MKDIIDRVKKRIMTKGRVTDMDSLARPRVYPRARPDAVARAEKELGFPLPPLLRELYLQVGNGGFGPGYGLICINGGSLDCGNTIIELYQGMLLPDPQEPLWAWPPRLARFCHWGCAIYSCVDCSAPPYPVSIFDPNNHEFGTPWESARSPQAGSFEELISDWADGADLWECVYGTMEGAEP